MASKIYNFSVIGTVNIYQTDSKVNLDSVDKIAWLFGWYDEHGIDDSTVLSVETLTNLRSELSSEIDNLKTLAENCETKETLNACVEKLYDMSEYSGQDRDSYYRVFGYVFQPVNSATWSNMVTSVQNRLNVVSAILDTINVNSGLVAIW